MIYKASSSHNTHFNKVAVEDRSSLSFIMASSLTTLRADFEPIPPYDTLESKADDGEVVRVVATGGLISNFNDVIIDDTALDVQTTKVKAFPLNTPLPIPRVGGSTSLKFEIPIDNLLNPSSLNIVLVFSVNKRGDDGTSKPIEMVDGIVPVCGYYPLSNAILYFDNSQVTGSDMENLELNTIRNMRIMELIKNGGEEDMERLHKSYTGWHINHQSFADSKTGNYGAYTHTDGTHVISAISPKKTDKGMISQAFNFQQENIDLMIANEFTSIVEIPNTFLDKTRITPFIIKDVNVDIKWANVGNIFSQEQPIPTTKDGVWDSLHFVLKNAYVSYQNILANPALINSYSSVTLKNSEQMEKDERSHLPLAYPSWVIKNLHKYDDKTVPAGQSSVLISLKGRLIPEILTITIRRKSQINSKIGNYRYLDYPNIKTVNFSTPTYSHLKYLESNRSGISMFHGVLDDIDSFETYKGKSNKIKKRILKQLDYLTIYESRAIRNIPFEGELDIITKPDILLNGHFSLVKSYRRAIMSGGGVKSKPILADIKVEIEFGKRTSEELLIESYGSSDAVMSVQADRSFRLSHEDGGTSVKQSIAVHESLAKSREDMNLRVSDI